MQDKYRVVGLITLILFVAPLGVSSLAEENEYLIDLPEGFGPYEVGWIDINNISETQDVVLPISIYYPSINPGENSVPDTYDAPYPAIFISPGIGTDIPYYRQFTERMTSWGFVFVIVGSKYDAYDLQREQDVIEALNWVEEQNSNASFELHQIIDESRLGVAGHSMGGAATVLVSGKESRFKVSVLIAAFIWQGTEASIDSIADTNVPTLILVGSKDGTPLNIAPDIYEKCNSPKYLFILEDVSHENIVTQFKCQKYFVSFLKAYLSGEEGYFSYLYGELAQQDIEDGKIELYYDMSVRAPVFELGSLEINPSTVEISGEVTASIEVSNTGNKTGSYTLTLKINEEVEEEKSVTLDPGESVQVVFEILNTEEGIFSVDLNGLSGSFHVEKAQAGIQGFSIESIVLSMVLVITVLRLLHRQR